MNPALIFILLGLQTLLLGSTLLFFEGAIVDVVIKVNFDLISVDLGISLLSKHTH